MNWTVTVKIKVDQTSHASSFWSETSHWTLPKSKERTDGMFSLSRVWNLQVDSRAPWWTTLQIQVVGTMAALQRFAKIDDEQIDPNTVHRTERNLGYQRTKPVPGNSVRKKIWKTGNSLGYWLTNVLIGENEATAFRSGLGQIHWLASTTHPKLAVAHSILGSYMAKPVEGCMEALKAAVRYA